MAFLQDHHKLRLLITVPRFCTFLLLVRLLATCSHASRQPCQCLGSNPDQLERESFSTTFDQMPGNLLRMNSNTSELVRDGLSSYMKAHPKFNLSSDVWFFPSYPFLLWQTNDDRTGVYEASFSFIFTFNISMVENHTERNSSLVVAILPHYYQYQLSIRSKALTGRQLNTYNSPTTSRKIGGTSFSAQVIVNETDAPPSNVLKIILVQISIESVVDHNAANKYSLWIDYSSLVHRIYVYLDEGEAKPYAFNAILVTSLNISDIMPEYGAIGFFSSMGQILRLETWNSTSSSVRVPTIFRPSSQSNSKTIILSSVLGSAAATVITAALVYFYFTSKYRRWKQEQDKLTKAMQQLPGVPTKIDYTDIRKATKNFHETTKLGKGGFGTVYRCTLAPAATKTGQPLDVAVKKFMQEVEDRRYNDFLAEVSIINRLRHKNIVPLVGWSYNKGEPLLIYEYMANGSLDQHLFCRGGKRKRSEEAATRHWDTRYAIVRDIATGLHYVHHEHEPMVLHRDIKASNIMLDSNFSARLGDFGIACTVSVDRRSVTVVAGTIGYIAPDYVIGQKATRQSDIYALGVLILEIVTGKKSGDVPLDDGHITDWVWRLHQEGKLLEAMDHEVVATDDRQEDVADEARRLLLLGLACTNPNPSNRPSMMEVVQVINKLVPTPQVPLERPIFVWPPEDWRTHKSLYSTAMNDWETNAASTVELMQFSKERPLSVTTQRGQFSIDSIAAPSE